MKTLNFIATCFILVFATESSFGQVVPPAKPPFEGPEVIFTGNQPFTCSEVKLEIDRIVGNTVIAHDACGNEHVLTVNNIKQLPDNFSPACRLFVLFTTPSAMQAGKVMFNIQVDCN